MVIYLKDKIWKGDKIMRQKQVMFYESLEKKHHEFLDQLLQNCNIDRETGKFYCKKCQNLVHIDWHRDLAFCGVHIISRIGVTYIEELYKIYI